MSIRFRVCRLPTVFDFYIVTIERACHSLLATQTRASRLARRPPGLAFPSLTSESEPIYAIINLSLHLSALGARGNAVNYCIHSVDNMSRTHRSGLSGLSVWSQLELVAPANSEHTRHH